MVEHAGGAGGVGGSQEVGKGRARSPEVGGGSGESALIVAVSTVAAKEVEDARADGRCVVLG